MAVEGKKGGGGRFRPLWGKIARFSELLGFFLLVQDLLGDRQAPGGQHL